MGCDGLQVALPSSIAKRVWAVGGVCIAVPWTTVTLWSKSPDLPAFEIGVNLIALCFRHLFDIIAILLASLAFRLGYHSVLRRSVREDGEGPDQFYKRYRRRARGATMLATHNWPWERIRDETSPR